MVYSTIHRTNTARKLSAYAAKSSISLAVGGSLKLPP
jgi:hypothetical protein